MILGSLFFLIGLLIRMKAIKDMGNFSFALHEQEVCTTGIYKYMRHPSYVGSMVCFSGLMLIDTRLALAYLIFIFYFARAVQEEHLFGNNLKYTEYKQSTGMFIPRLRR